MSAWHSDPETAIVLGLEFLIVILVAAIILRYDWPSWPARSGPREIKSSDEPNIESSDAPRIWPRLIYMSILVSGVLFSFVVLDVWLLSTASPTNVAYQVTDAALEKAVQDESKLVQKAIDGQSQIIQLLIPHPPAPPTPPQSTTTVSGSETGMVSGNVGTTLSIGWRQWNDGTTVGFVFLVIGLVSLVICSVLFFRIYLRRKRYLSSGQQGASKDSTDQNGNRIDFLLKISLRITVAGTITGGAVTGASLVKIDNLVKFDGAKFTASYDASASSPTPVTIVLGTQQANVPGPPTPGPTPSPQPPGPTPANSVPKLDCGANNPQADPAENYQVGLFVLASDTELQPPAIALQSSVDRVSQVIKGNRSGRQLVGLFVVGSADPRPIIDLFRERNMVTITVSRPNERCKSLPTCGLQTSFRISRS